MSVRERWSFTVTRTEMERRSSAAFRSRCGPTLMDAKHHCGVQANRGMPRFQGATSFSSGTDLCISWSVIGHIAAMGTFQLPLLGPECV
jgi:hypothetical protein